eukprot:gnl/TRDRNA2_/TRDRNA2_60731_c0_seq1.p1 gnl/TRDRNA2_/TRDRNA2_60731_c0~~gnl/TRDRNA2_/TRDRNA2_60731_c0_seq1.p1  ORF type:complete len:591 (+),score=114.88 gnl/TRDRNA2_/TRDRNA2_60731_c0_seq1:55-1827(+)
MTVRPARETQEPPNLEGPITGIPAKLIQDIRNIPVDELAAAYQGPDQIPDYGVTTLMIRNLPRSYTTEAVMCEVEAFLPTESYDFIYLPWDTRRGSNISYAFINFVDGELAARCFFALSGMNWGLVRTLKCCRIAAAHVQGLAPNLAHYVASPSMQEDQHPHGPVVIHKGQRMDLEVAIKTFCTPQLLASVRNQKKEQEVGGHNSHMNNMNMPHASENRHIPNDMQMPGPTSFGPRNAILQSSPAYGQWPQVRPYPSEPDMAAKNKRLQMPGTMPGMPSVEFQPLQADGSAFMSSESNKDMAAVAAALATAQDKITEFKHAFTDFCQGIDYGYEDELSVAQLELFAQSSGEDHSGFLFWARFRQLCKAFARSPSTMPEMGQNMNHLFVGMSRNSAPKQNGVFNSSSTTASSNDTPMWRPDKIQMPGGAGKGGGKPARREGLPVLSPNMQDINTASMEKDPALYHQFQAYCQNLKEMLDRPRTGEGEMQAMAAPGTWNQDSDGLMKQDDGHLPPTPQQLLLQAQAAHRSAEAERAGVPHAAVVQMMLRMAAEAQPANMNGVQGMAPMRNAMPAPVQARPPPHLQPDCTQFM